MTPRFSILMPTYNRAAFLPETLESVFAQRFADYELIVVDDGSSDGTPALLARYGERLRVLRQARRGPGAARNLGLAQARGEYVIFLDSDDLFMPWTLEVFDQVIRAHGAPTMAMCAPYRFCPQHPLEALEGPVVAYSYPDYLASAPARHPVTVAAAVRREALLAAGGFLEHHHCSEDQDLFLRLGDKPGFSFIAGPVLYGYRQHSVSKTRETEALYQGALLVLGRERKGVYPGGRARYPERAVILARKNRFTLSNLIAQGRADLAYRLLWRSLPHLLAAGYWRDLYRFPLAALTRRQPPEPSQAPKPKQLPSEG